MIHALAETTTVMLTSATQSAGATRSATLDCVGSDYAKIVIPLGIEVNTNGVGPTIVLSEGDTTSSFATWSSSCTRTAESLETAHAVNYLVNLKGRKRYLKLAITSETTTNDHVTAAAIAILSRQGQSSPGTAALRGSTNDVVVVI